jgi:mannose-1-phosphate guanylyltransferase
VILAGGAGTRLLGVTGGVPKQFWRPNGGPSLLEETLARVGTLTPPERCVIVLDEAHREYIGACAVGGARLVAQPHNRGTAAGVLSGLVAVLSADPEAVVLITPSDHGVVDPAPFLSAIRNAATRAASSDNVVLLGVAPSVAHTDHGWIAVGPEDTPAGIRRVAGFFEKPGVAMARQLLESGSLLNTMVIVGRARTLLRLCRERVPDLAACFVGALTLPPEIRDTAVRATYRALPTRDFSRDVLTGVDGLLVSRIPEQAGWSDLGTPDRVANWLATRRDSRRASPQRCTSRTTRPAPGRPGAWEPGRLPVAAGTTHVESGGA